MDVRLTEDMFDPSISDCVFMPNGHLVACDDVNYTIKLFDSSLSLKDSLKLPTHPCHVALIDDNTVIVTIPLKPGNSFSAFTCFLRSRLAASLS